MTLLVKYVLFIHDLLHDIEAPFEIDDIRLAGLLRCYEVAVCHHDSVIYIIDEAAPHLLTLFVYHDEHRIFARLLIE